MTPANAIQPSLLSFLRSAGKLLQGSLNVLDKYRKVSAMGAEKNWRTFVGVIKYIRDILERFFKERKGRRNTGGHSQWS